MPPSCCSGVENGKKELTIQSLLELFEKASGAEFDDPEALLTVD